MDKKIQQTQQKFCSGQANQIKTISYLEAENTRLNKEIASLALQKKESESKLKNYQEQIKILEQKLKLYQEENQLKYASLEEKIEQLHLEKEYYIKEKEQLLLELYNGYQQNEDQNTMTNQFSQKINSLKTENLKVQDQLQQKNSELEALTQNYQILSNAYNQLQDEVLNYKLSYFKLDCIKVNMPEQSQVPQQSPLQCPAILHQLKEQLINADIFQTDLEKFQLQILQLIDEEFQTDNCTLQNFVLKLSELIEANLQHKL